MKVVFLIPNTGLLLLWLLPTCPGLSVKIQAHPSKTCWTPSCYLCCCTFRHAVISASKTLSSTQLPTSRCLTNSYPYFKTQYKNHFPWEVLLTPTRLYPVISHIYLAIALTTFLLSSLSPKTNKPWAHLQGEAMVNLPVSQNRSCPYVFK